MGKNLEEDLAELTSLARSLNVSIVENQQAFDQQQRALAETRIQLVAERNLLERYRAALEGLTPGGSEFVNDPENCAWYVREAMNRQHETIKRFKYRGDEPLAFVQRVAKIRLSLESFHKDGADFRYDAASDVNLLNRLIEEARALERGKT
jgi:hypothetical protein